LEKNRLHPTPRPSYAARRAGNPSAQETVSSMLPSAIRAVACGRFDPKGSRRNPACRFGKRLSQSAQA
jgi:hypothetical protein